MTDHSSTPSTAAGPALRHAVRHFAVSTGVTVDPAAIAAALRTGDLTDDIRVAVDVWPELIEAMPLTGAIRNRILARLTCLQLVAEVRSDFRPTPGAGDRA